MRSMHGLLLGADDHETVCAVVSPPATSARRRRRTFHHPRDGFLRYEQATFNLASHPDLKLTILVRLPPRARLIGASSGASAAAAAHRRLARLYLRRIWPRSA
jgi:hypothetical protein